MLPQPPAGCRKYNPDRAPCICVEGVDKTEAEHKDIHLKLDAVEHGYSAKGTWTYEEAREAGIDSLSAIDDFDEKKCKRECIQAQLDDYHKVKCCMKDGKPPNTTVLKASPYPAAAAAASGTPTGSNP